MGASLANTKIDVGRESVDGTRGHQRLSGHVTIQPPGSWRRTSHDGAPTAALRIVDGACTTVVQVSVRAVATSTSAATRARAVTGAHPADVIADSPRAGGRVGRAARGLPRLLRTAAIHARVVRA